MYEHVFLQEGRNDWNLGQLWYEKKRPNLTSIFKLRYAHRFNQSAYLTEAELYPEFSEKSYAHFKIGVSLTRKGLFPNFRAMGIFYHNVSESLVGGLGLRYQTFEIGDVLIYEADIHWYLKDYLFITQSFIQEEQRKLLGTVVFTARKYLVPPTYIFVKMAYGQSPEGLRFEEDVFNSFESLFFSVGSEIKVSDQFLISPRLKIRRNTFNSASSRYRFGVAGKISYQF